MSTTYYVAASGSNANNGTSTATPFATVSHAQTVAVDGDTILLHCGDTINESASITFTVGVTIGAYGSGAPPHLAFAVNPGLQFSNIDGWTIENLAISSPQDTSATASNDTIYCLNTDGTTRSRPITIQNCTITGGRASVGFNATATALTKTSNITIQNNTLTGGGLGGIGLAAPSGLFETGWYSAVTIKGNNLYSIGSSNLGAHGIVLYGSDSSVGPCVIESNDINGVGARGQGGWGMFVIANDGLVVRGNVIRNVLGTEGAGFDIDSLNSNVTVEYNQITNTDGPSVEYYPNSTLGGNVIRFNTLINGGRQYVSSSTFGGAGVSINWSVGVGGTAGPGGIEVYNNTIVSQTYNNAPISSPSSDAGTIYNVKCYNNLCIAPYGTPMVYLGGALSGCDFDGNAYRAGTTAPKFYLNGTTYTGLSAWQTGSGFDAHAVALPATTNGAPFLPRSLSMPLSVATASGITTDFAPFSGSGLIGAGLDLATKYSINPGTQDLVGNAIPVPYAIGAINQAGSYSSGYVAAVAADAPAWWYRLAEASGSLNLTDSCCNLGAGVWNGTTTLGSTSILPADPTTCLALSGSGGNGEVTAAQATGGATLSTASFTHESWVDLSSLTPNGTNATFIAFLAPAASSNSYVSHVINTSGQVVVAAYDGTNTIKALTAAGTAVAGQLYQIVSVFTGPSNTIAVYVNGVLMPVTYATQQTVSSVQYQFLWLGSNTTTNSFSGSLAGSAFFPTALSASRIAAHYQAAATAVAAAGGAILLGL